MLRLLKLVYKNMVVGRPKVALYGLVFLALACTANLYFNVMELAGQTYGVVFSAAALGAWFFVLPCVMTFIDIKVKPGRIDKILESIKE